MYSKNHGDTGADMAFSLGTALQKLSKIVSRLKPNIILSGFDIGANLAVAIVGAHLNIPVAHLEAGEVTGTIDESIRHSISKFAHFHFTTNSISTKRLIEMGENKKWIFTVGNPSLDSILTTKIISKKNLSKEFHIDFLQPYVIVLQHPVTSEVEKTDRHFFETLKAIKDLNLQAIIILGNADAGSTKMIKILKNSRIKFYKTLTFEKYINLLKHASALVGNSSSGKMEAPFLHVPSINIGTRQNGRLKAKSVIDVRYDKYQIKKFVKKAIYDQSFKKENLQTKKYVWRWKFK